ncbi:MAG: carbohydrate ABC transporter permease [Chlorobia bacterium]|nr:carbohydrate ABC transporter permease [Fimbriimonadaceae bacterium]
MTAGLIYAIGTLVTWAGWFYAFKVCFTLFQLGLGVPGADRAKSIKSLGLWAGIGAIGLLVGAWLPSRLEAKPAQPVILPLVWFVMPYAAWLSVICLALLLVRVFQRWFALTLEESRDREKAALAWLVGFIAFIAIYQLDKDNKIEILKGGIPFSLETIAGLVLGLLAAMAAMIAAGRAVKSRGLSKALVNQVALIAGSIVFGLPFAFLVSTSFKEDRDMSSPNGIVWIPRVQDTVDYMDPKNPLYVTEYQGQQVRGVVVENRPDGTSKLDVEQPLAIRGTTVEVPKSALKEIPRKAPLYSGKLDGQPFEGFVAENLEDGGFKLKLTKPDSLKGQLKDFQPGQLKPVRHVGLRTQNYPEALSYLPPETNGGLVYLKNSLVLVVLSVIGTILSSSIVAYAFSRMKFPGRDFLFGILLATMMLPGAVTLLPQFLIFRSLGWIDTLLPLWVPMFFASAFNVFLLRQFFKGIPMELEDAAKIDGCSYLRAFWNIMLPQIKPALAVIAIWTFMGAWNNFMGPLIYINSPENMPLSYALQLFQGDRSGEPGLLMAFATLAILPVLAVFFFAQKYFIEGVTLSGMGGR